ncbi:hypothetical protein HPMBJEAJ_00030 [Aeromonas phage avDM6]|nr:hypothetical protein HPMBJEAJ_00030 [Aeromonas phage avDM6]
MISFILMLMSIYVIVYSVLILKGCHKKYSLLWPLVAFWVVVTLIQIWIEMIWVKILDFKNYISKIR